MDLKKIDKESCYLSEQLFIDHNISDIRTKRLIKEYYFDEIYKQELMKEKKNDSII